MTRLQILMGSIPFTKIGEKTSAVYSPDFFFKNFFFYFFF